MVCFFFGGGRNKCEIEFELFVRRKTFGTLARYLFGKPLFILGIFSERRHSFGDFLRNQNFFDTSTYIRITMYGKKAPQ